MHMKCVTLRLEGLFIIEKQWKTLNIKNLTLGDEAPKLWALFGKIGTPTSQGRNFDIQSLFDVKNTLLERSIEDQQNFSASPKIKSCARIKETERKQCWGFKWNRQVATNIHLDQSSSLRKQWSPSLLSASMRWGNFC